jgi:hypothetical protein
MGATAWLVDDQRSTQVERYCIRPHRRQKLLRLPPPALDRESKDALLILVQYQAV